MTETRTNPSTISSLAKPQSRSSNLIAIKIELGVDFSNAKAADDTAGVVVKKEKRDEPLEDGECSSSGDE